MYIKEDRAKVTLGNLIKIPPNFLLDLSPITLGRMKMFSKFIFICLQNMVSWNLAIKKMLELTKEGYMYHFFLLLIISDPGQCADITDGWGGEG